MAKQIGVLALQGDFERHAAALEACGAVVRTVRQSDELAGLNGLVIPGGESTTIGKLLVRFGLFGAIQDLLKNEFPGTCAGLIVLAQRIAGYDQPHFSALDADVDRNAYGRQVESFEADIAVPALGPEPLRAVFIRAPIITRTGPAVSVLARFEDKPVLVRQKNLLGSTFHPELTPDRRVHQYFLSMI
jgi:5'-phosphate synthase pdxT subunit